ncbi:MAG: AAA family ATPase [Candidatus Rokubacteria bacterium]|nr:AAA family ATPase [Candidatus Rokubacteria bacterium]
MKCPRCQHENPTGAAFCDECGARLEAVCSACGDANRVGAKFCRRCGQPLTVAAAPGSNFTSPESYTPKHLAEKIVTSRAALEGERKQVTVLFADVKGSLELLAGRDPEETRTLLDPVLEHMMEAVHRFEGTVNQVMGDGIMALFGAPLAHEDHAVRACYAALRMQESVKRYAEGVQRAKGVLIQIRVGLNSGEVVVRSIGSDLHMDYTAVGQTTHLAARMEQLAAPGSIRLTADTLRRAEGYVEATPLGPVAVKGLAAPVEIYELSGASGVRSRLQAAAARRLTGFVGRDAELAELGRAAERARAGHGQIVAIVGEPGVGKSRLIAEFTHARLPGAWRVVEAGTASYARSTPYLGVTSLLRAYLQIEEGDDEGKIREKMASLVLGLDESLRDAEEAVYSLFDIGVEQPSWRDLDPAQRQRRLLDAVRRLLLRQSQEQPLCLVLEDLQWVDTDSQTLLDRLIESLPTARILFLPSYRPEYSHGWANKSYYSQLRIDALPPDQAAELLDGLLGSADELRSLKTLLIERTEGNPFFLEETVRHLIETGALAGQRGAYRPTRPIVTLETPSTVQAVLAARIDRLPEDEKHLLQAAAVIGRDVPFHLLASISDLGEERLRHSLAQLQLAELLYEVSLFPQTEYSFKHALTQEVALGGILHERQRALDARIVEVIERLYPDRLAEHVERLAHHASRGEVWDKAVDYLRHAGSRAFARGALAEAVDRYEQSLGLLPRLGAGRQNLLRAIDVRLDLHAPLMTLGRVQRLMEVGREAEHLARQADDTARLGRVLYQMGYFSWLSAQYGTSLEYGEQVLAIAETRDDTALWLRATHLLGLNRLAQADFGVAIDLLKRVVDGPHAAAARERLTLLMTYVDACGWLAFCLGAQGDFQAALAYADRAVALADGSQHPQPQAIAYGFHAIPLIVRGDFSLALPWCERAAHVCQNKDVLAWMPTAYSLWGWALAWLGRHEESLKYLEAGATARERMNVTTNLALFHFRWADGLLRAGRLAEAGRAAGRALELARAAGERGHEALALHVLGEATAAAAPAEPEAAADQLRRAAALAERLGMRPLLARCRLSLGELWARAGRRGEALSELTGAAGLFESMGMTFWLGRARAELDRADR